MRNKIKIIGILSFLFLLLGQPVWAAGPPSPSIFNSALALSLLLLMGVLLIVIAILGNMLVGAADIKLKKRKELEASSVTKILVPVFLMISSSLMAQDAGQATKAPATIGDLTASTFYIMVSIIFMELLVIVGLLLNIRSLLKVEKESLAIKSLTEEERVKIRKNKLSWWDRFNKLKPVSEEADLDLGHEYDGIRELNNRLPPWWLYGFYLTIVFAGIYLWRFHVSHTGPSSAQEYEASVVRAEMKINAYLKEKGEAVDENTVTILTAKEDLSEGKIIFEKSCATCHKVTGAGDVGPNLTDDFWIHGNDIKSVFKTIRYGINAMPQWQMAYSNKQIAQVASYVKSLHGTNPPNPKAPQGVEIKEENPSTPIDSISTAKTDTTTAATKQK